MLNYYRYIELTKLKYEISKETISLVKTANHYGAAGVCVLPEVLHLVNKHKNKQLRVITIAGFPPLNMFDKFKENCYKREYQLLLGKYSNKALKEIEQIIDSNLTDELDLVFPVEQYVQGDFLSIYRLLKGIVEKYKKPVKVIIELGTLFKDRMALYEISDLLVQAGVTYLKTNTGLIPQDFNNLLSNLLKLKVLHQDTNINLLLKASGGIRNIKQVKQLISLGVSRIGTSKLEGSNYEDTE